MDSFPWHLQTPEQREAAGKQLMLGHVAQRAQFPTPLVSDENQGGRNSWTTEELKENTKRRVKEGGCSSDFTQLSNVVRSFPTPTSFDSDQTGRNSWDLERIEEETEKRKLEGRTAASVGLSNHVRTYPTPRAALAKFGNAATAREESEGRCNLEDAAMYPTPVSMNSVAGNKYLRNCEKGKPDKTTSLTVQAARREGMHAINDPRIERLLPGMNEPLPGEKVVTTPTASDSTMKAPTYSSPLNKRMGAKDLKAHWLNPDWVEWLMGWPIGWTDTHRVITDDEMAEWAFNLEMGIWWYAEPEGLSRMVYVGGDKELEKRITSRLHGIGNGQVSLVFAVMWRLLSMGGMAERKKYNPTKKRSRIISAIQDGQAGQELKLQLLLEAAGFNDFEVDADDLCGCPDVVFRDLKIAIFVNGCFWHGCPKHYKAPATNTDYWDAKIKANKKQDAQDTRVLKKAGWTVIRVWEHDLNETRAKELPKKIVEALT